jgi:hypothetical protein
MDVLGVKSDHGFKPFFKHQTTGGISEIGSAGGWDMESLTRNVLSRVPNNEQHCWALES